MNIRSLILTLAIVIGSLMPTYAVPAMPTPITVTQPDGTPITVRLYGDERGHYYTTLQGELLLDTETGFRLASLNQDGSIAESSLYMPGMRYSTNPTHNAIMIEAMCKKIAQASPKHPYVNKTSLPSKPKTALENGMTPPANPIPGLFPGSDFPTIGSPKVLVILVEYSDVKFSSQSAPNTIKAQITSRNYKDRGFTGSALDYYANASMEQFTPQFDVMGPVSLPNPQAYYGGNNPTTGEDSHPREMVIDACNMIASQVDMSQYDNNHDGYVDNVYIIYAGRGEASGGGANTIWPHSWAIPESMTPDYNGTKLFSYACGNELTVQSGNLTLDAIGTFCHEFGHVLGLPDLYSTGYHCNNHPGSWALMASGSYTNNSRTPPTLSSWERGALGWLTPTLLATTGDYELKASLINTNSAFLIPTQHANEYFMLENRQPYMDDWDNYVASWGMLVWHIDYNEQKWNQNIVNDNANHQYANIVEAHGNDLSNFSPMEVCFPSLGHNAFTESTKPALKAWDGSLTDIYLPSISENEDDESPDYASVYFKAVSRTNYNGVEYVQQDNDMNITVNGLTIQVTNVDASVPVLVYTSDGNLVSSATQGMDMTLPSAGIYIVRCNTKVSKIILH